MYEIGQDMENFMNPRFILLLSFGCACPSQKLCKQAGSHPSTAMLLVFPSVNRCMKAVDELLGCVLQVVGQGRLFGQVGFLLGCVYLLKYLICCAEILRVILY